VKHIDVSEPTAYTDGGGQKGLPCACAAVIYLPKPGKCGFTEFQLGKPLGDDVTNNEAEYEGVILALESALRLQVPSLKIFSDSQLIVYQIRGEWKIRKEELYVYWERVLELGAEFEYVDINWIRREQNVVSDDLCWKAKESSNGVFLRR
jgi:ribonuclease HI